MLEQLDLVDWVQLEDANGHAGHVPGCMRALSSPSVGIWAPAIQELWDSVDQGVVYQVTPKTIPFLIELASEPSVVCRSRIMELLGDIAMSIGYWSKVTKGPWPMSAGELLAYREILAEAKTAIIQRIGVAARNLIDNDPKVRISTAYWLGHSAEIILVRDSDIRINADTIEPLGYRLANDQDFLVRSSVAFAIARYVELSTKSFEYLHNALIADASRTVRLSIAMAMCRPNAELANEAITELVIALRDRESTDQLFFAPPSTEVQEWETSSLAGRYHAAGFVENKSENMGVARSFPWFIKRPFHHVIESVCRTQREYFPQFANALSNILRNSKELDFSVECEPILRYCFSVPYKPLDVIATPAYNLLSSLYQNRTIWSEPNAYRDAALLALNLPQSPKDWVPYEVKIQPGG